MSSFQFTIKRVKGLTKSTVKTCIRSGQIQDIPGLGRAPTPKGRPNFCENRMKMKTFARQGEGARPEIYYVDPPLHVVVR